MTEEVAAFYEGIEDDRMRRFCIQVHEFILHLDERLDDSIKYGVPFIHFHKNICFFNPKEHHLIIGFIQGAQLSDPEGCLEGEQKLIRHFIIRPNEAEKLEYTRALVLESLWLVGA